MTSASPTAASICRHFDLSAKASELLTPTIVAGEFLQQLTENRLYPDALRFVTYALSKREAVWFGCLVVQHFKAAVSSEERKALEAAFHWVLDPSEQRRLACGETGTNAKLKTPAGALAMGAFWSGGSMHENRVIAPPEYLTARSVAGAVSLAISKGDAVGTSQRYCQAIVVAIDVSAGSLPWTPNRS